DTGPPTVTAPTSQSASGFSTGADAVATSWAVSGQLATAVIERSVDGAPFASIPASGSATSITQSLPYGHSYRYRVMATNWFGEASPWAYGPTITPAIIGDASSSLRYAGVWHTQRYANYLTGSDHWSTSAGSTATLTFSGRAFSWVSATGPTRGRARVTVDGKLVATIDLGGKPTHSRVIALSRAWSTSATHRVIITVVGTGSARRIDLDGFLILQ
ncbi:MAG TPA: hypothetical protein VEG29_00340, partial [Candidatus Binatia bacterium]|nr:hypothetical protein [Candidatus Binatia bacterium]